MKLSIRACLVLISLFALPASAAEVHGVKMPDAITVEGKGLKLNGIGVRTKSLFNIKVYVAALYLEATNNDADRIIASDSARRLVLRMTHNAPKDRLKEELHDGLEKNSKDKLEALRERLGRFLNGVPDLKEGQVLTITYMPGKGTSIKATNAGEVTVPGKDFADAILRGWLGKNPLDDDLKKRLLGAK